MTINADSIEEYLNTEDIVYISSLPTPEEKESAIFSRITTLPTVQVRINPGQTETPIKNSIPTYRNLSTDTINNCDLGEKIQIAISEQGGCFNTEDLPEIATIEELLNHLCEVLIRFDTDPNNYLKDDYTVLLKTICNSLIHLYLNENEIDYNKALNKPRINDIELVGNKTSHDLNLADVNHNHDNLYGTKQEILDLQSSKADASDLILINEQITINTDDISDLETNKQDKLTAGENIVINDNVISADLNDYLKTEDASTIYETVANVQILSNTVSENAEAIEDLEENKADKASTLSEYGITDGVTESTMTSHVESNLHLTEGQRTKLEGIEAGAEVNVNADWNATTGDSQILNKPNTLTGYGITDAYTKTEINTKLNNNRTYKILNTPVSTWSNSTTYTKYPYEAVILIENIKESDSVEVIYNNIDASSGNYAPGGELYNGYIKLYSKVNTTITIPTLVITKIDL